MSAVGVKTKHGQTTSNKDMSKHEKVKTWKFNKIDLMIQKKMLRICDNPLTRQQGTVHRQSIQGFNIEPVNTVG